MRAKFLPASRPAASNAARQLTRRSALLLPLALGACSWFDFMTSSSEDKRIPGLHEDVLAPTRGLGVDNPGDVVLPPQTRNDTWLEFGGGPTHEGGNFTGGLTRAWRSNVGRGDDWRARFTAEPLVDGQAVYTMDTRGQVSAFALSDGARLWRTDTAPEDSNDDVVGGSIGINDGTLYAATAHAEILAIDPASGKIRWRAPLPAPGRGGPTFGGGQMFVATADDRVVCLSPSDGKFIWDYRAAPSLAGMLAHAAPAFSENLVIAGFGSGDLVALRADSGSAAWSDNLGALKGNAGLAELASIRGGVVVHNGILYANGLGGLLAAFDLRSGRRVWQRDVAGANTPWLAGDVLYVLSIDQRAAAVSAHDGSVYWASDLPRFENPKRTKDLITWSGPVMASGKLLFVNDHAQMAVLDPLSGKIVSTIDLEDTATLRPVVAAGTVFVLTDDASLTAYR